MKTKKCHFCKAEREIDKLEKVEVGDKTKLQKYACPECKKNYLDRKEFFSYFHEALDIPKMDRWTVMNINTIAQDYNYEVMIHALKIKEKAMLNNFEKGFPYILAILKNQLPFSHKEIKKQKERTFYEERQNVNIDIGDVNFNKNKIDTKDYSNLLD
jgi:transposase-like protein